MITRSELKKALIYDELTGLFTRACNAGRHDRYKKGSKSGSLDKSNGYIKVSVLSKSYYAHRLAWLYSYGYMPKNEIDHIDGDRTNNKLSNLRDVNHQANARNQTLRKNNKSGAVGVCWYKQKNMWRAYIHVDNKFVHLGFYKKHKDAVRKRKAASSKVGFHKNHGKDKGIVLFKPRGSEYDELERKQNE